MKLQHNLMNLFIWIELFIYLISYKELIIVHELTNNIINTATGLHKCIKVKCQWK